VPRTTTILIASLVALLTATRFLREPVVPAATAGQMRLLCGSERWPVKTFADADRFNVDLNRRYRTIKQLNDLPRPSPRPQNSRVAGELSVYRVNATVAVTINEDDGDVHLALQGDDGSTLIAEAPEPACTPHARDRAAISRARLAAQDVRVGEKVVATGVGFFDFAHHQTGHAQNYIELHPLLSIRKLHSLTGATSLPP
jgi:hypothetical protein